VTKRDRIVLVVVAALAVLGGFYMTVLKPIRADLAELDEQRTQAEQRRDTALADLNAATTARAAYRRDTATLALLGKAVPADDGVPSLLYQVEGAAKKSGVTFDTVKVGEGGAATAAPAAGTAAAGAAAADPTPGTSEGPEGLQALPLKITFQGQFFKLEKFLSQVHRFARVDGERVDIEGRLLTIEGVKLTPGASGLPTLTAEITAKAYVAPAEAAKTGAAAAGSATTASTTTPSGTAPASSTATESGAPR
jgi:Tfp pilus assembly protein PilO